MFSGIVSGSFPCLDFIESSSKIIFKRPSSFTNLSVGDSVSVDGVCLTLENLKKDEMTFALGVETLSVTKWDSSSFENRFFNLEKALTLHQPLGGHLLTGHVDGRMKVLSSKKKQESLILKLEIPEGYLKFFCPKGFLALNGVSLTINQVRQNEMEVCIIPQTLKMSNLSQLKANDFCLFEVDYYARILIHHFTSLSKSEILLKS